MSAFTDTVDTTGVYTTGICGEKLVSLDAGTPSFLTLAKDATDPLNNALTISYSSATATEADVKVHTVAYTVTFKEYTGRPAHSGTFQFELKCLAAVQSSSLDSAIKSTTEYDVISGATLSLPLPVVSLTPAFCFTVTAFEVTD